MNEPKEFIASEAVVRGQQCCSDDLVSAYLFRGRTGRIMFISDNDAAKGERVHSIYGAEMKIGRTPIVYLSST